MKAFIFAGAFLFFFAFSLSPFYAESLKKDEFYFSVRTGIVLPDLDLTDESGRVVREKNFQSFGAALGYNATSKKRVFQLEAEFGYGEDDFNDRFSYEILHYGVAAKYIFLSSNVISPFIGVSSGIGKGELEMKGKCGINLRTGEEVCGESSTLKDTESYFGGSVGVIISYSFRPMIQYRYYDIGDISVTEFLVAMQVPF